MSEINGLATSSRRTMLALCPVPISIRAAPPALTELDHLFLALAGGLVSAALQPLRPAQSLPPVSSPVCTLSPPSFHSRPLLPPPGTLLLVFMHKSGQFPDKSVGFLMAGPMSLWFPHHDQHL